MSAGQVIGRSHQRRGPSLRSRPRRPTRVIRETVAALPQTQRAVITLRDMIGCTPEETCNALGLTDTNQRVLLHRARTKVRAALEAAFDTTEARCVNEMDCKELVEAITAYLDGALPAADRRRFDAHLAECPYCTEYLEQMRKTIARLGTIDETALSHEARERLLNAFRDWRS